MRLFLTGDTHGSLEITKLSRKRFPLGRSLTKDDCVLIAGDFGFPWGGKYAREDYYWLEWIEDLPFSVAFCDGNHSNFPLLYNYPVEEWHGGLTHVLRPHIHHLMRGEIFEFNGSSFFVFGGARSTDRERRKEGISWWPQEIASYQEMDNGIKNIELHHWKVDYILTHCAPNRIVDVLFPYENQHDDMSVYLEHVMDWTDFKKFFCGHYHINRSTPDGKYNLLYDNIIELFPDGHTEVVK